MNAISRNAFASLTLLFALSAFVQANEVNTASAFAEFSCTPSTTAPDCEIGMITGSINKTANGSKSSAPLPAHL